LAEKVDRSVLKRVAQSTDDQQEIVRLVREVSFAIEIAMVCLLSCASCVCANVAPPNEFDVTIRNETLILQAIKGINWLRDSHGERPYLDLFSILAETSR
jgi:hypothetical protein